MSGQQAEPPQRRRLDISKFPATFGLIAVTVSVFIGQLISQTLFQTDWLLQSGLKSSQAIASGQYWRILTPLFLHVNALHIFVNMYSLYAIGPAVERFFGTPRFIAQYLLAGVAGVIFSLAFNPFPSAGASGAIFGTLGSLAAFLYAHRELFGQFGRLQLRQVLLVALLNLGLGLMPGIDNWGHLGGLLTGGVLAYLLGPRFEITWLSEGERQLRDKRTWEATRWGYLVAAAILLMLAPVALVVAPR